MADRPRLLVVPTLTELEWPLLPALREWADVACYDVPAIGTEPAIRAALGAVDELGWDRYVVVADEWAVLSALHVAHARRDSVQALALGHASLSWRARGPRPPMMEHVRHAFVQAAQHDWTMFARHMTQTTGGDYDDETMRAWAERVPHDLQRDSLTTVLEDHEEIGDMLRSLDVPMLLVRHAKCMLWTQEGFEDCVAALPHATAASIDHKPSVSPEFSQLLRDFCARLQSS